MAKWCWLDSYRTWRQKNRTLYRYNEKELSELRQAVEETAAHAQEVAVIFNNNAGGDAADNARALIEAMQIDYQQLNPSQLELFWGVIWLKQFFDIDGTLIADNGKAMASTRAAIKEARKQGVLCGVATGRGPVGIRESHRLFRFGYVHHL